MPVLFQRTQTVQDLLEEIKAQAPQASQEVLSPASSLAKTAQEVATLVLQIQTSVAAMANAPVGQIVVSLVIKLLQLADATLLEAGGPSPSNDVLVNKVINRTARILHNIDQAWPHRNRHRLSDLFHKKDAHNCWSYKEAKRPAANLTDSHPPKP